MRGKASGCTSRASMYRITPACAGKSNKFLTRFSTEKDHPRMCGEKESVNDGTAIRAGSPPRMRGKGPARGWRSIQKGITPAHAGKSPRALRRPGGRRDHPRTCGEKWVMVRIVTEFWGSPPHMRGKGRFEVFISKPLGITPAHAGKSLRDVKSVLQLPDHPRTCGEKQRSSAALV